MQDDRRRDNAYHTSKDEVLPELKHPMTSASNSNSHIHLNSKQRITRLNGVTKSAFRKYMLT